MPDDRAIFIVNPAAGRRFPAAALQRAIESVAVEQGFTPSIWRTEAPGHAATLAAAAAKAGARYVFAVGGDGTVNEVINGLPAGSASALGIIPAGTANVWAKEAGVPRLPVAAMRAQLNGVERAIDVGRAGPRRFLLNAGYGLDGESVPRVSGAMKRLTGRGAYVLSGLRTGLRYPGFHAVLDFGEEQLPVHASLLLVANTGLYGGVANLAPRASVVDGLLDCVIFTGNPRRSIHQLPLALVGRHLGLRSVLYRRVPRLTIRPAPGERMPRLQVDGDIGPDDAAVVTVEPGALRILIPDPERPLFR